MDMDILRRLNQHVQAQQEVHLETLFALLRQPSVSSTGEGVQACAELLAELMTGSGLHTEIHSTEGWPVVYGERLLDSSYPTVLIYGHYDVQPVGDLNLWETPPYEPNLRGGRIYARGSADNKGQFFAHLVALQALSELGEFPSVNVKLLIEGEEEIASAHLKPYIESHQAQLESDLVYSADGPMHTSERATLSLGCRGILHLELEAVGARRDVHSGQYGGVVPSPAMTVVQLLATLVDAHGRVQVDGFYEEVLPPTDEEAAVLKTIPISSGEVLNEIGLAWDELKQEEFNRRLMFQPNFNLAGLSSGYSGEGIKTIIPNRAVAKVDIRLVADQNPDEIADRILAHVRARFPQVQVRVLGKVPPSRTPLAHPLVPVIQQAVRRVVDHEPVIELRKGGTVPDYLFTSVLERPSIWVPYANPDNANHAPNENLRLDCFFQGVACTASMLLALAESRS